MTRPRLRDLGVTVGRCPVGPLNAITDVEGVCVGHSTLIEGEGPLQPGKGPVRTGVTAVIPHRHIFNERLMAGAFVLNGAGEMTGLTQVVEWGLIETPIALTNTHAVGRCSSAIVGYMVDKHPEIGGSKDVIIPVVGECDDSWLSDIAGRHVRRRHVTAALDGARGGPVQEGSVGGGTGMITCDLKGGIGTSSRRVAIAGGAEFTVGVLVMSNFGVLEDLLVAGHPLGQRLAAERAVPRRMEDYGSIIAVVATDAPLLSAQISRLCKRAALGIGRCGSIAGNGSGEIVIGFSTTASVPRAATSRLHRFEVLPDRLIDPLYRGTIEATEEAILNALCAAEPMEGRDGNRVEALPLEYVRALARAPAHSPA